MKGPRDYETLRERWQSFTIVNEHGRFVAKTVGQAESLVYTDDPSAARPARFRDDRTWVRASAKSRRDAVDQACVRRMHELRTRYRFSVRVAAARAAVEFWVAGPTFGSVVHRLTRAYNRAEAKKQRHVRGTWTKVCQIGAERK